MAGSPGAPGLVMVSINFSASYSLEWYLGKTIKLCLEIQPDLTLTSYAHTLHMLPLSQPPMLVPADALSDWRLLTCDREADTDVQTRVW